MPLPTSTYTPQAAIDVATDYVKSIGFTDIDEELVDMVHSRIWTYYPWRWSLASLTNISIGDGNQDLTIAAGDNDVYRLHRIRITRTDTSPDEHHEIPNIVEFLSPEGTKVDYRNINSACHLYPDDEIRLSYSVNVPSGVTLVLAGEYQTTPTKITNANLSTVFTMPDVFFPVMVDGLLHYAYKLADDDRAGTVQANGRGGVVYTGQLGIFMDALNAMAAAEQNGIGDTRYPEVPVGARGYFGGPPGLFG